MVESFGYDSLNRLTSTSVNLTPTPLNKSFTYSAIGNLTSKSDVGTYTYPASGQPRPHAVTSISGGLINTSFTYDAKGNMTAGNGLTVAYASYDKPTSITRGISTIGFSHDPEHQRFQQVAPGGTTLYLGNGSAYAEKFTGSDGSVRWSNYLVAAGGLVGMHVENSDETVLTRYFHKDHLGSIAVITNESGTVLERLSYDAWGKRRYADGSDDPAGAITSQTNRGFTGHPWSECTPASSELRTRGYSETALSQAGTVQVGRCSPYILSSGGEKVRGPASVSRPHHQDAACALRRHRE